MVFSIKNVLEEGELFVIRTLFALYVITNPVLEEGELCLTAGGVTVGNVTCGMP